MKRLRNWMGLAVSVAMLMSWAGVAGQEVEPAESSGESDPVLAVVDGTEIKTSAVARRVVTMFEQGGMTIRVEGAKAMMEKMQEQVLSEMITEKLLENAALAAKIEVSEEEVTAKLEEFKKQLPEKESYDAYLRRYGATDAMVRKDIERNARVKKWVDGQTADLPKPPDDEIEKIYLDRPEYAITLGKAKVRHIFLSTAEVKDEEHGKQRIREAKAIWDRLVGENAEDFEEVAKEVSEDPESAEYGGDIGEVKEGELADDINQVIFTQPVGMVGPAIPTKDGLHIFKVESRTETKHHTLKEATPVILRNLMAKQHNEKMYKVLEGLYEKAEIKVLDTETGKLVDYGG